MRIITLILLMFLVSACVISRQAQVLRFDNGLEVGKRFAIVAEGAQQGDLEFTHYAELVNAQLQTHGFPQAQSLDAADYRVFFSYHTDSGKQVIETHPDYGFYGGVNNYGDGFGVGGTLYDPYYQRRSVTSYTTYTHRLELRIIAASQRGMPTLWQGKATMEDGNSSINAVMPCLVAALFSGFPAGGGVEQAVMVPTAICS
jgi:hypothetical protein